MEQDFEKILNKLVASTRSPRGKFSKANSWILLEKRLPRLQRRILSLRTMASAAAVAVLCVLGWWAYYMFAPVPLQTVSTLAETRSITLPDQTEIVLNRYSTLTYPERFRGKDRKVQLQGEAYFEVSKDAAHPFKVEAEAVIVQVLGTHFNIEAYPEDAQVKTTLLEGSVAVSLIGKKEERLVLSPNESAIYNKDKKSLTLHTEKDASEEIAWRNGTLLFKSIPLQLFQDQRPPHYRRIILKIFPQLLWSFPKTILTIRIFGKNNLFTFPEFLHVIMGDPIINQREFSNTPINFFPSLNPST